MVLRLVGSWRSGWAWSGSHFLVGPIARSSSRMAAVRKTASPTAAGQRPPAAPIHP